MNLLNDPTMSVLKVVHLVYYSSLVINHYFYVISNHTRLIWPTVQVHFIIIPLACFHLLTCSRIIFSRFRIVELSATSCLQAQTALIAHE